MPSGDYAHGSIAQRQPFHDINPTVCRHWFRLDSIIFSQAASPGWTGRCELYDRFESLAKEGRYILLQRKCLVARVLNLLIAFTRNLSGTRKGLQRLGASEKKLETTKLSLSLMPRLERWPINGTLATRDSKSTTIGSVL